MQDVILSVQDLEVEFTLRGKTLHAIRGISLDICEGESLAIVGESGSGKSVFCTTFMGLLDSNGRVTRGSIRYGEKDLAGSDDQPESAQNRRRADLRSADAAPGNEGGGRQAKSY